MYAVNRSGWDGRMVWKYAKSKRWCVVSNRATHNHPVDMTEIKVHKIRSRLKTKIQETAQPLPTLYSHEVLQIVTDPNTDNV